MTMPLWKAKAAARATSGRAVGDWSVFGLSIDTRTLVEGDLFVPLKDHRDGHEFIPQAYAAGAGAVISEQDIDDQPALIVGDSLQALRDLATASRNRSKAMVIAVTGSVGKTGVKNAIATLCNTSGLTHKSQKSFNNHWGVPLTMAMMPVEAQYGVFEAGMNHAGELFDLSNLLRPDIAIITKIAPAHLAHFESLDAIAAAKAEVFAGLVAGGTAILNADDIYFEFLKSKAEEAGATIISVGYNDSADLRISDVNLSAFSVSATFHIDGKAHDVRINLAGEHWAYNAAFAVAATHAAGVPLESALQGLSLLTPSPGRGEIIPLALDDKDVTLIDDSYNANPASMRAAIAVLDGSGPGRKIAVLGDMYELGKDEVDLHAALSDPLEAAGIDRVLVTGECMRALRGAVSRPMRGAWARDWQQLYEALREELQDGDTVLVKGSNATGLGQLVKALKTDGGVL